MEKTAKTTLGPQEASPDARRTSDIPEPPNAPEASKVPELSRDLEVSKTTQQGNSGSVSETWSGSESGPEPVNGGSRSIEGFLMGMGTLWERGLCVDCLGRQAARLGYGLTNGRRGRAVLITLSMVREFAREPPHWLTALDLPYLHGAKGPGEVEAEGDGDRDRDGDREPEAEPEAMAEADADDPKRDDGDGEGKDGEDTERDDGAVADMAARASQCPLCDGLFTQLDDLADMIDEALRPYEASSFKMGCVVDDHLVEAQAALVRELGSNVTENLKQHLNRELSHRLARLSDLEPDPNEPDLFILLDTRYDTVKVQAASLFIKGRYRKLVRNLPQTHWPCRDCEGLGCHRCEGTGYRYRSSVEQLITAPFMEASNAVDEKFHGAGREDIDVRCLGSGRPFVIELRQPRMRRLDLGELADIVNEEAKGVVEVEALAWCRRNHVAAIKEAHYDKTYRAQVAFDSPVDEESLKKALNLMARRVIQQQTPSRVAHRRAAKVRERHLRGFKVIGLQERGCELELTCEHGTYVKELIHGDEGRTVPSLTALLETPCQVTALDVLAVHDDQ